MDTEQSTENSVPSVENRLAKLLMPEVASKEAPAEEAPAEPQVEEEQVEDDGLDDLDLGDYVLRVPKDAKAKISEWKDGALMRENFTQKTQALAELHRQTQAASEALAIRGQFEQEVTKERGELARIEADLERYKQVDWANLDTSTYIKLREQRDELKGQADQIKQNIGLKAQQVTEALKAKEKDASDAGQKFLGQKIPGWGAEAAKVAYEGLTDVGYTNPELEKMLDGRPIVLAWKAAQYDKLMSGKASAVASVQKAPPVVKPGAVVPGASAERKYKEVRAALKKSGSLQDAARVLLLRGNK